MELSSIISLFGISPNSSITQIYTSAWDIDGKYILKTNSSSTQLDMSISLCNLLLSMYVPVPEYIKTTKKELYLQMNDTHYCIMKKRPGHHFDPFVGNAYENGIMLGKIVAELHTALRRICTNFDCHDTNYIEQFDGWIMNEVKSKRIDVPQEIIDYCYSFEPLYDTLPRQLIHRDMHLGNLLFEGNNFAGYLDFDISQKDIRILDICILVVLMLVNNYKNESRIQIWNDIVRGVIIGYGTVLELTISEISAIPNVLVLQEMSYVAFFEQTGLHDISLDCVNIAKWLYSRKDDITNLLV